MNKKLMAALLFAMPLGANATVISGYGAYAGATTASYCPNGLCQSGYQRPGDFQHDTDGAEFATSTSAAQTSYAAAEAYAALTGDTYLPELKVRASADEGKGGFARAFGVQGFTYTGSEAGTVTLDINLHGSVDSSNNSNSLSAQIAVITGSDMGWYPSFATLVYEVAQGERLGTESVSIWDGLDVNNHGSISFDVVPGLDFYVIASLGASASNGFADGWHTLTMSFDDPTGMRAATGGGNVSAVPVPAAAWLFGSGIVGFIGARRRKSQRQAAH